MLTLAQVRRFFRLNPDLFVICYNIGSLLSTIQCVFDFFYFIIEFGNIFLALLVTETSIDDGNRVYEGGDS